MLAALPLPLPLRAALSEALVNPCSPSSTQWLRANGYPTAPHLTSRHSLLDSTVAVCPGGLYPIGPQAHRCKGSQHLFGGRTELLLQCVSLAPGPTRGFRTKGPFVVVSITTGQLQLLSARGRGQGEAGDRPTQSKTSRRTALRLEIYTVKNVMLNILIFGRSN